jgi:ubiquinone/menaquinone biosynthesis C-methylase UbiE
VFEEAFRVLKSSGRLMVSDIVLLKELPKIVKENVRAYVGCVAGAEMKDKYLQLIKEAGFEKVKIVEETPFPVEYMINDPTAKAVIKASKLSTEKVKEIANTVASIKVFGTKP